MDDQRMIRRTSFDGKNPPQGFVVCGISAKPVDGFRGKGHDAAGT
jgi:hypothetical protein